MRNQKSIWLLLIGLATTTSFAQTENNSVNQLQVKHDSIKYNFEELKNLQIAYANLKSNTDKLLKTNDSILNVIGKQRTENLLSQKKLYENNYSLIRNTLSDIKNLESQIDNYKKLLNVAISGTLITSLNNPTNNVLGKSFSDIAIENANTILTKDMNKKAKSGFLETIKRLVEIPVVTSLVDANPISSLVKGVFQFAAGYDENSIPESSLKQYIGALEPYTEFYNAIDSKTVAFRNDLMVYKYDLKKTEHNLIKYKKQIYEALGSSSELADSQVNTLFLTNQESLNLDQYIQVNNNKNVALAIQSINKMPDFYVDQDQFTVSYNQYLDDVIALLNDTKNNSKLRFDSKKISNLATSLAETKIGK